MQKLLTWSLQEESEHVSGDPVFQKLPGGGVSLEDRFDVISVQFAIHYMMQTRKRARRFFQTCNELLEVGGNLICTTIDARVVLDKLMNLGLNLHFDGEDHPKEAVVEAGNGACRISFAGETVKKIFHVLSKERNFDSEELFGLEYTFTLVEGTDHKAGIGDAVNLPEWLNPIPMLEALADEAGMKLVSAENFHEFYNNRKDPAVHPKAHKALYNMKVLDRNGSIFPDNWDISRMYCAIKFQKIGESTIILADDEDIEHDDDENEPEAKQQGTKSMIDPVKSQKMLPIAMMKAKKTVGANKWQELSNEEKKQLTQIELTTLMSSE
jgi:mRNA (guanine-N7-)-methyltransferase